MKKIIAILLCTFLFAGCRNSVSSDTSGREKLNFRIGDMTADADLNECSVTGWCRITDENRTFRTTYSGKISDNDDLYKFITQLDVSGFEQAHHGLREEYSVTIKSKEVGFIRIVSGMATVYGYDDLENATESEEPAISIKTGKSVSDCTTSTYLVPYKFRQQFDEIITEAIVNEKNITDVLNLTD